MTVEIKTLPTLRDVELQLKAAFDAAVENLSTISKACDNKKGSHFIGSLKHHEKEDIYKLSTQRVTPIMALNRVKIQKKYKENGVSMQKVFDGVQTIMSNMAGDPCDNGTQGTYAAKKFLKAYLEAARDDQKGLHSDLSSEIEELITEMDAAFGG